MKKILLLTAIFYLGLTFKWDHNEKIVSIHLGQNSYAQFGNYEKGSTTNSLENSVSSGTCYSGTYCYGYEWINDNGCTIDYYYTNCWCDDENGSPMWQPDIYQFTAESPSYDPCTCEGWVKGDLYIDNDNDGFHSGKRYGCTSELDLKDWTYGVDCNDFDAWVTGEEAHYQDSDRDGYSVGGAVYMCPTPNDDWITNPKGTDCDDSNINIQVLDECNNCVSENDDLYVNIYYYDGDGDGYSDPGNERYMCDSEFNSLDASERDKWLRNPDGEDCNDSNASIQVEDECDNCVSENTDLQSKTYYYDGDLDNYYLPGSQTIMCATEYNSLSEDEKLRWIENGIDEDCNDNDYSIRTLKAWYKDVDGDGYYVDYKISCEPPGKYWNEYSNLNQDGDDSNIYVQNTLCNSLGYANPSLIKPYSEHYPNLVMYNFTLYEIDEIGLLYNGSNYSYDEIFYDKVVSKTISEKGLIIPSGVPLIGAEITGEPASIWGRADDAARQTTTNETASAPGPEVPSWMDYIFNRVMRFRNKSRATGVLYVKGENGDKFSSEYNYIARDFDSRNVRAYFDQIANRLSRTGLTVGVNISEEVPGDPNSVERDEVQLNYTFAEKVGDAIRPHVYIYLRYTIEGTVEYMIVFNNDFFVPNDEAINKKNQNIIDNDLPTDQWNKDSDEFKNILGQINLHRSSMINTMAHRYPNYNFEPQTSNSDGSTGPIQVNPEEYPGYEAGELGLIEGWLEYLAYASQIIKDLETPRDSYDNYGEYLEGYEEWKVHGVGSLAGLFDSGLEEVSDLKDMVQIAESMFDERFWSQVLKSLKNLDVDKLVQSQINNVEEVISEIKGEKGTPRQYYQSIYQGVKLIRTAIGVYKVLGKSFTNVFDAECDPSNYSNNIIDNSGGKLFDDLIPENLMKSDNYRKLDAGDQKNLIEDIASTDQDGLADVLASRTEFVTSWKRINNEIGDANVNLRKNPDVLNAVDNAKIQGVDGVDALQDANQTISTAANPKPTWPELQALFKRGNDFNKRARTESWYDYHEINLANGKRLDSYDPDLGEIVSRKATSFDDIQLSTFENYLKELDSKYSPGTMIKSKKYPDLDGKILQGKKILEVPATNQTHSNLVDFQELADSYSVEIRFQNEY